MFFLYSLQHLEWISCVVVMDRSVVRVTVDGGWWWRSGMAVIQGKVRDGDLG